MNEIQAVRVHLTGADVPLVNPRDTRDQVLVPRTVTLTADTPADQLCQPNPGRKFLGLIANTNAVVLSRSKSDAQAPGNLAASITAPNGAYLPAGLLVWVPDCQNELWASTGTYPTMITVLEVTRRA